MSSRLTETNHVVRSSHAKKAPKCTGSVDPSATQRKKTPERPFVPALRDTFHEVALAWSECHARTSRQDTGPNQRKK